MGADMLIASLAVRKGKTARQTRRNIKTQLAVADRKINAARSVDELGYYRENYLPQHANGQPSMADIKKTLLGDLAEVRSALLGYHREAELIDGGSGLQILVSGSLSWGDEPCRLYTAINRLQTAAVIQDARYA